MRVEELPVSEPLKRFLKERGFVELYPPQEEACKRGLFSGKNLVFAAQTASGKTFLAEVACANAALSGRGKSVYLTPLKALASEKFSDFKKYEALGVKTALSVGDYDSDDPYLHMYDVVVTTYEKMDSLLRHKPKWFDEVSLVVVDELHYVDDEERGPVLESLISRIKYSGRQVQLLGLSATVGNPEELAAWLDAELVVSSWRPVPLREGVFYRGKIVYADGASKAVRQAYSHPVFDLVHDTALEGGQALVFVNSRKRAVELAEAAAKRMPQLDSSGELKELAERALESSEAPGLNKKLYEVLSKGYGFHHAGLTLEQRRIVEEGFRSGLLRAVFATPTLAAGVNLPARRVIVESLRRYSPIEGSVAIKVIEYKQFAGRAGRPGYDPYGEAVIVARSEADAKLAMKTYVLGSPEKVKSKLSSLRALRCHVLALISTEGPVGLGEIEKFASCSLYAVQASSSSLRSRLAAALDFLTSRGFVRDLGGSYEATKLGKRVSDVYVDPLSALVFLRAARNVAKPDAFALLFIIASTPDMPRLPVRRGEAEELELALEAVEPLAYAALEEGALEGYDDLLSAAKTASLLHDWISEVEEQEIVDKYDVGPGDVRTLAESCEWIAHAFEKVSELVPGADEYRRGYSKLKVRLRYGVKEELLELVELPGIGRVRARRLFNAGYKGLEDVARASPGEIAKIEGFGEKLATSVVEHARALLRLKRSQTSSKR